MKPMSELNDETLEAELRASRGLKDAPEWVIQRGIDLFSARAQAAVAQPLPSVLGSPLSRVLAALGFDSAGAWLPAHGVRGSAQSSRQLLFSAAGREIDVRIDADPGSATREGERWAVFGQLLGPDRGGRVELICGDVVREVALDELSEFRFEGVPGGKMVLALHLADLVIELPELELPRSRLT